jgi:hypothetical protein
MEYRAFLSHKLKKKQLQKLEKIQYRAIRGALSYRSSTANASRSQSSFNLLSFKQLGRNYVFRHYISSNYPTVRFLEEISILLDNPGRGENEKPLISDYYKDVINLGHSIQSGNCPFSFIYTYDSLFYEGTVFLNEGRQVKEAE